ncbi:MAG: hypothetical protein JOZ35_02970 [Hyphomicrobiales bacterium]|jgi:hypothetical protein|nr:hypothetical protein [Hyphomicrobiales bacterium]MBV8240531.1 hypothetical protein [Hyphomicrobiales bacterium]MBV8285865.1 hypothetical protein [Hyphomicrobiales bacterium]MBV8319473.1 hypothetical protein [Hyphomicrobiales bacterium]
MSAWLPKQTIGARFPSRGVSQRCAAPQLHMSRLVRYGFINGLPGFVTVEQDDTLQTTALQVENDKIVAIYVTRNPDRLRHIADHHLH